MWSILISFPTFVDSMCVCLILSHLQIQFSLHSNDFQAFPFCCDLSHNMWEIKVSCGLKRISVRGETIALRLTPEEKGACAQGFLFLKENSDWGWGE